MARREIITLENGEQIKLTEQEKLFAEYYLADPSQNGAKAARNAGYSEKTAKIQASRLLTNANLQRYLEHKTDPILKKLGIDQERVLRKLRDIAFTDLADLVDDEWDLKRKEDIPKEFHAALAAVEKEQKILMQNGEAGTVLNTKIKYKLKDNIKPLLTLAEMTRLIQPRGNNQVSDQPQQINIFNQINNYLKEK